MTPIRRGKQGIYYLYIPKQKGGVELRTTGTIDKRTYTLMKALVARLKAERRWALLTALITRKTWLGEVYDADRANNLDLLEASLSAQGLWVHRDGYLGSCKARGLAPRNVENIDRQLEAFLHWLNRKGTGVTTIDLTTANVTAWLASLEATSGTRRQYLYAVTGFTRYLCDIEVLKDYPLSRVKAPKKNQPRMSYVDAATDEMIVTASPATYQALFAFIKATGCDLTTALNIQRRHIDLTTGTARLKGTKTAQRDVHKALIEPWALPYLADALCVVLPNANPWGYITRSMAAKRHEQACEAVKVKGYTLKDARHSVAVRMMEAGYNVQEIAEQLGNSPELVARVYSRFAPKMDRRVTPHVTVTKNA